MGAEIKTRSHSSWLPYFALACSILLAWAAPLGDYSGHATHNTADPRLCRYCAATQLLCNLRLYNMLEDHHDEPLF